MAACRLSHCINITRLAQSVGMICTAAGTRDKSRGAAQPVSMATEIMIATSLILVLITVLMFGTALVFGAHTFHTTTERQV